MTKISRRTPAAEASTCFFANVTLRHGVRHDHYIGTARALVDAGLVTFDQLPGRGGRGTTMTTFNSDGTPIGQGCNSGNRFEEGAKRIKVLTGGRYRVDWAVSEEEVRRRLQELDERRALDCAKRSMLEVIKAASEGSRVGAVANLPPKKRATPALIQLLPATFEAGDCCISVFDGAYEEFTVWRGYGVYFVNGWGKRSGYLVKAVDSGEILFRPAGSLRDLRGGSRHLSVVR